MSVSQSEWIAQSKRRSASSSELGQRLEACPVMQLDELFPDVAHLAVGVVDPPGRVLDTFERVLAQVDHVRRLLVLEQLLDRSDRRLHVARVVVHGPVVHEVVDDDGGFDRLPVRLEVGVQRRRLRSFKGELRIEELIGCGSLHEQLNEGFLVAREQIGADVNL